MSKLRFRIAMSLDGFVAGPSQSVDNPLGIGGMRLHEAGRRCFFAQKLDLATGWRALTDRLSPGNELEMMSG